MTWLLKTQPKLIPTLVTIPALLLVACLGIWQVQRLMWKEALIAQIEASLSSQPQTLDDALAELKTTDPKNLPFVHVMLEGEYQHQAEQHMAARYHKGSLGYHLYTPLDTKDAVWVLVNRGWIPKEQKNAESRPDTHASGAVKLRGVIRHPSRRGLFSPDNHAEDNMWFWEDLSAMQAGWPEEQKKLPYVVDVLEVQTPTTNQDAKTTLPIPATAKLTLRNDHLAYAITWFSMFIAILVIYILYHRKLDS
jgi:surfeit locus 1 family protein